MANDPTLASDLAPATFPAEEGLSAGPTAGVGLCLSGGGYRAMLFHLGSLWRLKHADMLKTGAIQRISSVSGGSITAGTLAIAWGTMGFMDDPDDARFRSTVVEPIRALARNTIDVGSVLGGLVNPFGSIADSVADKYRSYLFQDKTVQDLPDEPRFVFNAANVQTGALWRFSKPFMGDFRVGLVMKPTIELAVAVGASSAFPPFLSPVHLKLNPSAFQADSTADLQRPPYTNHVVLSDGGVYDNLGLETVFKRYDTVLVSDAGAKLQPEEQPASDWARHSYRVLELEDNQVRSLRKRLLIDAYKDGSRKGAYWGIRTDIRKYEIDDPLNDRCPLERTLELAAVPTRLAALADDIQERLINWGYAVCNAALRKHVNPTLSSPGLLPYERTGVLGGISLLETSCGLDEIPMWLLKHSGYPYGLPLGCCPVSIAMCGLWASMSCPTSINGKLFGRTSFAAITADITSLSRKPLQSPQIAPRILAFSKTLR